MNPAFCFLVFVALIISIKARDVVKRSICGKNEQFLICGPSCQATCNNTVPSCDLQCVDDCFCEKGYVRESVGGPCILLRQCLESKYPYCGPNEEYSKCEARCPDKCLGFSRPQLLNCSDPCVKRCTCKKGFIKVIEGGACIPEDSCSQICTRYEVYKTCGTKCPWGHDNINHPPCLHCVKDCFCEDVICLSSPGEIIG